MYESALFEIGVCLRYFNIFWDAFGEMGLCLQVFCL